MNNNKVALVTGGMDMLGTAICRRLQRAGYTVAITYGPEQTPGGWLAAQRDEGFRFASYRVDVSDYADAEWMMQKLLTEQGRLDLLVNHRSGRRDALLEAMALVDWNFVLRTNLDALFNMSKQAVEQMTSQRSGRIVNMASVLGQQGAAGTSNFAAASAAVHGFSKALALEVARLGITVNTVSAGALRGAGKDLLPLVPMGRLGEPEEVAGLVAYLASDVAAFVTGANIAINGGQHMC